jgi:hypothetical protein
LKHINIEIMPRKNPTMSSKHPNKRESRAALLLNKQK